MTVAGFVLILVGLVVGLTTPIQTAYNGQWMLGFAMSILGLLLVWHNRKGGPRDRQKE